MSSFFMIPFKTYFWFYQELTDKQKKKSIKENQPKLSSIFTLIIPISLQIIILILILLLIQIKINIEIIGLWHTRRHSGVRLASSSLLAALLPARHWKCWQLAVARQSGLDQAGWGYHTLHHRMTLTHRHMGKWLQIEQADLNSRICVP